MNRTKRVLAMLVALALLTGLGALAPLGFAGPAEAQPEQAAPELRANPVEGAVPGDALGTASDTELWRAIRGGIQGTVSIPDKKAGQLIQSEGDNWRAVRNGPLSTYGAWALLGTVILLAIFFALRGRMRVESGFAGVTITRFGWIERMSHWLTAVPFVILALTGLNILYGRYTLLPLIGDEAFAVITLWGKYLHNYLAFAFIAGLVMMFVLWVGNNIPRWVDVVWLLKGGGMFSRGAHVDAYKFNAGQKILFWVVILGGTSVAVSGWALMFPFTTNLFSHTFDLVNTVGGTNLPTDLAAVQEQQLAQLWHAIMALVLTCGIIAHIYIGTIGMEGAFDAMGTGEVDLNWAREHHNLWVDEVETKMARNPGTQPAE